VLIKVFKFLMGRKLIKVFKFLMGRKPDWFLPWWLRTVTTTVGLYSGPQVTNVGKLFWTGPKSQNLSEALQTYLVPSKRSRRRVSSTGLPDGLHIFKPKIQIWVIFRGH
jgi:hypothetical protein